ncbi:MAG: UbiA family prenyltransferase [Pirellulales bacterium]|nr:UbiA family prenyltransferase [Pirellulales bacterium]
MNDLRGSLLTTRGSAKDRLLAVAQLMRLANVFTAMADVWMGFILVVGSLQPVLLSLGLTMCSCLLYTAGMVLNDVMDISVDSVQRPERPLPSGRVSLHFAAVLGWSLLGAGVLAGFGMSVLSRNAAPGLIAWALSVMIVAYNSWLKNTWCGPFAMAACRAANVLLGMSPRIVQLDPYDCFLVLDTLAPAAGIGCYVCGICWFAREEHGISRRGPLLLGVALMTGGLILIGAAPWWELAASCLQRPHWQWIAAWSVLGVLVLWRCIGAICKPVAGRVQQAVGYAILLIIPIDAAICWGYAEWGWACLVLALILPGRLLSRWLRVT